MPRKPIKINMETCSSDTQNSSSGYAQSLSGLSMPYHSNHPEAKTALIARARAGENVIKWKSSQPTPEGFGYHSLVWLGGIASCQDGPHYFDLYLNGVNTLRFYSGDSKTEITSHTLTKVGKAEEDVGNSVETESGVEFYFDKQLTDMFGDCFGWFHLIFPAEEGQYPEGIDLEIRAEEADSQDWLMVFEHVVDCLPRLRIDPLLVKRGDQLKQILSINLDSFEEEAWLKIEAEGEAKQEHILERGLNSFEIDLPETEQADTVTVEFYVNKVLIQTQEVAIQPVIPRRVYILPYSHNDIGYTHIQTDVIKMQCHNIDVALRLAEQHQQFPSHAQAKWNLEVIWALEHWWDQASELAKQRFIHAVQRGQIGLNALYANLLSGLCNLAELNHHFDLAHKVTQLTGNKIVTATVTDIPGFVWSLQTALFDNEVKYFSIAPNAGDRTGHIYAGLGDKPFYWVSPCGTKQVLTWVKGASYSLFHREKITTTGISKLLGYLRELEAKKYPYEIVAMPYTIGGDNGGPDEDLPQFVKNWNEQYASPQLIIATHEQLFTDFESQYGDTLPKLQGDMTPYWEDGVCSTALETTLTRNAADRLLQAEAVFALTNPQDYPAEEFGAAWQQVLLWDEHTWGAWNSVSEPDLPFVREQWRIKQGFALQSAKLSGELLQSALASEEFSPETKMLNIINTLSYPHSAVFRLPHNIIPSSKEFAIQRDTKGDLECRVEFLQGWQTVSMPITYREMLLADQSTSREINLAQQPLLPDWTLENPNVKICFDESTGTITSLYHKSRQQEYVNPLKPLLELAYLAGKYPQASTSLSEVSYLVKESGELYDKLIFAGKLPGCNKIMLSVILFQRQDRIDIELTIDKQAIREKESIHLAFPIDLPEGVLRYDSAGKPIEPEVNQLPGSNKNFFCPTGYVDVSDAKSGITVALTDAPLIEIGNMTAEMPWLQDIPANTTFYSYILNNYWHTNYKADQEGVMTFRYSMFLHVVFDPTEAFCFARMARTPIQYYASKHDQYVRETPLAIPPQPLVALSIKPVADKNGWLLHILNTGAGSFAWKIDKSKSDIQLYLSTVTGRQEGYELSDVTFLPYEQKYLLLKA